MYIPTVHPAPSQRLRQFCFQNPGRLDLNRAGNPDRHKESRGRDDDTSVWHGAISERPEDKRLQNEVNCRRPGANRCRLQLISGWLRATSLWVKAMSF